MAKRFVFVSAGILCLALAYHFGAESATAQAPSNAVVTSLPPCGSMQAAIVTANGDAYGADPCYGTWTRVGNVFAGGPTQLQQESFGGVKAGYR